MITSTYELIPDDEKPRSHSGRTGITRYLALSRLTQVTDASRAYSFTYDNLGRLLGTGTQYSFLSGTLTNSYAYDAASNRVSFSNPQSQITNYSYDSLNRLTSLSDANTGTFGFGYDALGRRTSLTRPNGVGTSYSYDTLSRLLSVLHNGGSLPGSAGYTYDAAGNRTSKTAVQEASPNPVSEISNYSYDPIYELTQAVVGGSLAESYSYDPVGNRLTSAGPTSYNYNASNELTSTSTATYTYDNNGNTVSKTTSAGTTSYTWDYENRLTSVTLPGTGGTAYFTYDPMGRRIRKAFGSATTIYAYDGDDVVEELGGGGNLLAHYTQGVGIDEPLAMTGTGGTYFYHADGLGSITSLTDGVGQIAASYVYDSSGKLTASTGAITNPFQYTAREFDSDAGLYYYRARYYDPETGRFLSEDPVQFSGGINFYAYVSNDATSYRDPSGLWSPMAHDALIRHALENCGIPDSQIASLQEYSREWDQSTQDPSFANYHSMAKPGQSVEDAIAKRNEIIADELEHAQTWWSLGKQDLALFDLAIAIHAIMDSTSPVHVDATGPIMWCGAMGCSAKQDPSGRSKGNNWHHSPAEGIGREDVKHLTDAVYQANDLAIGLAYSIMTKKGCGCHK